MPGEYVSGLFLVLMFCLCIVFCDFREGSDMYKLVGTLLELYAFVADGSGRPVYLAPYGRLADPNAEEAVGSWEELQGAFNRTMALSQIESRVHVSCGDMGRLRNHQW